MFWSVLMMLVNYVKCLLTMPYGLVIIYYCLWFVADGDVENSVCW